MANGQNLFARRMKDLEPQIRPFNGSLADAVGLLSVERATFDESPYSAQEIQKMLAEGPQRAWLAVAAGEVIGFVVAFPTYSWQSSRWEIDLLAVRPDWTGRGLATRLIRVAAEAGARVARWARAVTAVENQASLRAFRRAGFRPSAEPCHLLVRRIQGLKPSPEPVPGVAIRRAFHKMAPQRTNSSSFLLAEQGGQLTGYAELLKVQTILYRGIWIESLEAPTHLVRMALIQRTLDQAITAHLDEAGAMVPESNRSLQHTLLAAGFHSLGDFYWLWAELPLPNLLGTQEWIDPGSG